MNKEFLGAPSNYKVESFPESPYLKAKAEWDSRIGENVIQAKNWRVIAIILSFVVCILSAGSLYLGSMEKHIPVVVALNKINGETNVLGSVGELNYKPEQAEIKYFLSSFINKVRAVPTDPVIIKKNWNDAYLFLKREAANKLNNITNADKNNPLNNIGKETVIATPISINQVGNSNSYQARWTETRYNRNGGLLDEYTMSGVFSIAIEIPKKEKIIAINPLGIFITNFGWSREL